MSEDKSWLNYKHHDNTEQLVQILSRIWPNEVKRMAMRWVEPHNIIAACGALFWAGEREESLLKEGKERVAPDTFFKAKEDVQLALICIVKEQKLPEGKKK